MKTKTFSSYLLLLIALMLLANCKKHHKEKTIAPPDVPPISNKSKRFIPVKFEYNNKVTTLKYLDNTTLISGMESTDGRKEIYSYNNDQKLVKYERYQAGEQVYLIDYLRNTDGLVIKANRFTIAPKVYTPAGYNTFTYDVNNKIVSNKTYNNANKLLNEEVNEYSPIGDLIKITQKVNGQTDVIINLSYDDKNGIFKEVSYNKFLLINSTDDFLISAPRNLLNRFYASSSGAAYTYQYNESNYPSQYMITNGNSTKTIKVIYRQL